MSKFRVASTQETFWRLYHKLERGESFVYSRFGDGDFEVMLGRGDMLHSPNPALAAELTELYADRSPHHLVSIAMHQPEPYMADGLFAPWDNPEYEQFKHDRYYDNAVALHATAVFRPNVMQKMRALIYERPKVFVGSDSDANLERFLGEYYVVDTPHRDAYSSIDEWAPAAIELAKEHKLVIAAAGMATRALARRCLEIPGIQFLDIGSLADYACGLPTRTWIKLALKHYPDSRRILRG